MFREQRQKRGKKNTRTVGYMQWLSATLSSCLLARVVALWSTRTYCCIPGIYVVYLVYTFVALCRADCRLFCCALKALRYVNTVLSELVLCLRAACAQKRHRFEIKTKKRAKKRKERNVNGSIAGKALAFRPRRSTTQYQRSSTSAMTTLRAMVNTASKGLVPPRALRRGIIGGECCCCTDVLVLLWAVLRNALSCRFACRRG